MLHCVRSTFWHCSLCQKKKKEKKERNETISRIFCFVNATFVCWTGLLLFRWNRCQSIAVAQFPHRLFAMQQYNNRAVFWERFFCFHEFIVSFGFYFSFGKLPCDAIAGTKPSHRSNGQTDYIKANVWNVCCCISFRNLFNTNWNIMMRPYLWNCRRACSQCTQKFIW